MCFVWFLHQTAIATLKSINWLVSVKKKAFVPCEVRPETLYIAWIYLGIFPSHASLSKTNYKIFAKRSPPNAI